MVHMKKIANHFSYQHEYLYAWNRNSFVRHLASVPCKFMMNFKLISYFPQLIQMMKILTILENHILILAFVQFPRGKKCLSREKNKCRIDQPQLNSTIKCKYTQIAFQPFSNKCATKTFDNIVYLQFCYFEEANAYIYELPWGFSVDKCIWQSTHWTNLLGYYSVRRLKKPEHLQFAFDFVSIFCYSKDRLLTIAATQKIEIVHPIKQTFAFNFIAETEIGKVLNFFGKTAIIYIFHYL